MWMLVVVIVDLNGEACWKKRIVNSILWALIRWASNSWDKSKFAPRGVQLLANWRYYERFWLCLGRKCGKRGWWDGICSSLIGKLWACFWAFWGFLNVENIIFRIFSSYTIKNTQLPTQKSPKLIIFHDNFTVSHSMSTILNHIKHVRVRRRLMLALIIPLPHASLYVIGRRSPI